MSFTIANAQTLAESWFEDELDDALVLIWGNEFIQRIVNDKVWVETTYDLDDVVADTWTALPAAFVRFVSLTEDTYDTDYASYEVKNGKIKCEDAGDYTLTYIPYPADLATIATTVPLHDAFKYPMAEFLVFRYFKIELDDDDSYNASTEYEYRYLSSLKAIYDKMDLDSEQDGFQVGMRW
jgi:hypothetical protein